MRYMLDTNILIYVIKNEPQRVLERLKMHDPSEVCVSLITYAELMYGVEKSKMKYENRMKLAKLLAVIEIIGFDDKAAEEYGDIRATLEAKGTPIGPCDMLIAASARSKGCILVTNNAKEFSRIDDLTIENWAE